MTKWSTTGTTRKNRLALDVRDRFSIHGVLFYVDWAGLSVGDSFFIRTSASAADVKKALRPIATRRKFELAVHNRCEFGYFGVRVWRLL